MNSSAPAITDRESFLAQVKSSELLATVPFTHAVTALPRELATATAVAKHWVAEGVLTRFQAERLLAGRADGFVIGPYVILEQVGRGAMGRVYKARHRTMNRLVAIKVLAADLTRTQGTRERFQREVRAAARLNHTNIVTAYDANELGDRFYLVLEFVDGPNLDTLVQQRGPLPVGEACEIIRQTALGLQHAHELGLVHRDVKPANVLVARPSKRETACVAKIADFGIARVLPSVDATGQTPAGPTTGFLGTPDFVAPEQADDPCRADFRADLYALGCVFYFLLCGRPPFSGGTLSEKLARHRFAPALPITHIRGDVPPEVSALVQRLLAKSPTDRFTSAGEVAAQLEQICSTLGSATTVSYDLPPLQPGVHSFATGQLSGVAAAGGSETSPWSQLTEDSCRVDGFAPDLELSPRTPRNRQTLRRSASTSSGAVLGWCAAMAVLGLVLIVALIRALAS